MITDTKYYFGKNEDFPFPEIFNVENVWEVLAEKDRILREWVSGRRIETDLQDSFVTIRGPVFIGKGTHIKDFTIIEAEDDAPIYIGENCVIGPHAYIRKGTLIGNNVEVGRTEIKGSVILNGTQTHHHGYIGDSIIGRNVNIATSFDSGNLKHTSALDKKSTVKCGGVDTGLRKFGCVIGDYSKTGCKTTTAPGTLIGPNVWLDEGCVVSGFIPASTFRKRNVKTTIVDSGTVVEEFYMDETLKEKYVRLLK